ncbi:DUF1080 domain-containing protein [Oscillatoria amoena NRMC-F 0135]|jgi:hypothetical protein|nr:DUF1080 domain-containing protein [Oscillatoria amoena NRMC-F 0135]
MKLILGLSLALGTLLAASPEKPAKLEKGFVALFNGKDLTGWTKAKENEATFDVKDGVIVAVGPRCHLYYTGPFQGKPPDFKNFELKVDVMTKPNSNGGIYFHTAYQETGWPSKGFEVQVNNTYNRDPRKTGSLYMVQDFKDQIVEDNVWYTEHIIVKGNTVTVFVNDKKVVEWTQPEGYTGPNKDNPGRVLSSGTFALQGHDPGSTIMYRNIRVKPLK